MYELMDVDAGMDMDMDMDWIHSFCKMYDDVPESQRETQRQYLGAANSCGDLRFDEASGTKEEAKETLASVFMLTWPLEVSMDFMGILTEEKPWKL